MYYGMFYDWTMLLLIPAIILTVVAQARVSSAFRRYSQVPDIRGVTGEQAARQILDANGLHDVPIQIVSGNLADHYDPRSRSIHLSEEVCYGSSIASVAVAAHESGHAIQHAAHYVPLSVRNAIAVPVNVISQLAWPLLIIGIIMEQIGYATQGTMIFDIGIIAFFGVVVFHLITLPVELNASRRAIQQLRQHQMIAEEEQGAAKKVLSAAALTYLAALAMALANLLRLLLIRGRD